MSLIDPAQLFRRRIPSLDGLRAVAVTCVLVGHASNLDDSYGQVMSHHGLHWLRYLLAFTCDASFGVRLFFTLSGFLITWLLLVEENRTGQVSLKMFYIRRAMRILPVYWCFLIAAELIHTFRPSIGGSPTAFAEAFTFTMGWWPNHPYILGHTWSLSVEETFYLLWPLAFCTFSARGRWWIAWCVVGIMPLVRELLLLTGQERLFTFSVLGTADAIMWGCLAAMLLWRWPARVRRFAESYSTVGRLCACALIIFCTASVGWHFHHPALIRVQNHLRIIMLPLAISLDSLACGYLIWSLALFHRGLLFKILNQPAIIALGVLSYSLYLWHAPFIMYPRPYTPAWWQRYPQNLGLALLVAIASYFIIERPILQLKSRFKRTGAGARDVPPDNAPVAASAGNLK